MAKGGFEAVRADNDVVAASPRAYPGGTARQDAALVRDAAEHQDAPEAARGVQRVG